LSELCQIYTKFDIFLAKAILHVILRHWLNDELLFVCCWTCVYNRHGGHRAVRSMHHWSWVFQCFHLRWKRLYCSSTLPCKFSFAVSI